MTKDGGKFYITSQYHIGEISNDAKISTIVGLNPLSKTLIPSLLVRDSHKKVIYFVDQRALKKFDETTGISTSLSGSLSVLNGSIVDIPFLTFSVTLSATSFATFSKFDNKIYLKDSCRVIRIDPETLNFEKIMGNSCVNNIIPNVKGNDSPIPSITTAISGFAVDDTTGDVYISTSLPEIFKYDFKSQMMSKIVTFSKISPISSDEIVTNQTNIGIITNLQIRNGYIYVSTNNAIRRLEKLSENQYYMRTIVGNLIQGYSGDNLPALESSLDSTSAFYVKKNGDIIILDGGSSNINGVGSLIVRLYEKQSGLLINLAGQRTTTFYTADGKSEYSIFTTFTKQVEYDENTGDIYIIDGRTYLRKISPICDPNSSFNTWNNTCDPWLICNGTLATSSNVCNGFGSCIDVDVCKCRDGYQGKYCEITKINPQQSNDSSLASSTVLIVSIVIPIVVVLLLILIIIIIIAILLVCCVSSRRRRKQNLELAKIETENIELTNDFFLPTSSMIISSSMGSSVSSDSENVFSKYSDITRIGQGAFGSVFKVTDTRQGNKFKAIKVIKFESLTDLNTIMKEATQLSNIKHPNIIKVNDYYITNDNLLIIDMDYYEFGDLTKLKPESCSEKFIKQILKQMLSALNHVHTEMHIIHRYVIYSIYTMLKFNIQYFQYHRDLKPTNIFIKKLTNDSIETILADFGLAKKYQEMKGQSYAGTPLCKFLNTLQIVIMEYFK